MHRNDYTTVPMLVHFIVTLEVYVINCTISKAIFMLPFDTVFVAETWLNCKIVDNKTLPKFTGEIMVTGEGVLLEVNSPIPCKQLNVPVDVEAVTIQLDCFSIFVYVLYILPQ